MRVLLLDDDVELGKAMKPIFAKSGIDLTLSHSPTEAFAFLDGEEFDAMVLDMMLPELDGLEVCRTIRTRPSAFRDIPIVAMTARADLTDRIVALESGIDDYVAKPVEMRELVARIGAVTRRLRDHTPYEDKTESDCNLALSEPSMSAIFGPFSVNLTELEMRIMRALAESRGTFLSRGEILENIGYDTRSDPAIVDTIIYRIRQKFRNEGLGNDFIKTQRGKGYSIRAELTQ